MEYKKELSLGTKLKAYLGMNQDEKYDAHQRKLI